MGWQPFVNLLAFVLPLVAVAVQFPRWRSALWDYRRKSSTLIRGMFSVSSGVYSDDHWISSVTLENLKDRSVTIFGVYLQFGYNLYLDIDEFDQEPLILRPVRDMA